MFGLFEERTVFPRQWCKIISLLWYFLTKVTGYIVLKCHMDM